MMIGVHVLEPVVQVSPVASQRKVVPTLGCGVSVTDTLPGTSCEAVQPLLLRQISGGVVFATIRPPPFPDASTESVRATPNLTATLRFAVNSTLQTEPLRVVHPVHDVSMASTSGVGVRLTTV